MRVFRGYFFKDFFFDIYIFVLFRNRCFIWGFRVLCVYIDRFIDYIELSFVNLFVFRVFFGVGVLSFVLMF